MSAQRKTCNKSIDVVTAYTSIEDNASLSPASSNEDLQLWKKKARALRMRERTIKQEFQEYEENSKAYKSEMESLLKQSEMITVRLRQLNLVLEKDNETLKGKLSSMNKMIDTLQSELEHARNEKEKLFARNRLLEINGDKLEQANREMKVMAEEKDRQLNETIERLALLETDLEKTASLCTIVQRLKDENRDLLNHMKIKQRSKKNNSCVIDRLATNNDSQNSLNLSFQERVLMIPRKLSPDDFSYCPNRLNYELNYDDQKKSKIDVEKILPNDLEDIKQNFQAVIKELKKSNDSLPRRPHNRWPFKKKLLNASFLESIDNPWSASERSSFNLSLQNDFSKNSDCEPESKRKRRNGILGWARKKSFKFNKCKNSDLNRSTFYLISN